MSTPSKASTPLSSRDVNTALSPTKNYADKSFNPIFVGEKKPVFGMVNAPAGTYISPSDAIVSPASQKLAGMKARRFASAKPKTLFAKTVTNVHKSSIGSVGEDIKQPDDKKIEDLGQ